MLKIWRTCQAKRSKLSNADKCIEIRLASILQCQLYGGGRGRWMVRKGEDFSHKYSGILMASKFEILTFSFLKSTTKIAIHLQIDSKHPPKRAEQKVVEHQQAHLGLPTQQVNCCLHSFFPVLCMSMQIGSHTTPKQRYLIKDLCNLDTFFMGCGDMLYIKTH